MADAPPKNEGVGDPPPGSAAQRAQVELGLFSAVLPAYISIAAILDTETHHWLLVGLLPLAVWAYRIPRLGLHAVKGDPKKYWWKGVLLVLAGVGRRGGDWTGHLVLYHRKGAAAQG